MAADEVLLVADFEGCHFEIQEGRGDGFYVWRFEGESTISTHDHLQDDIVRAKACALDEWGVPTDAWRSPRTQEETRLSSARK